MSAFLKVKAEVEMTDLYTLRRALLMMGYPAGMIELREGGKCQLRGYHDDPRDEFCTLVLRKEAMPGPHNDLGANLVDGRVDFTICQYSWGDGFGEYGKAWIEKVEQYYTAADAMQLAEAEGCTCEWTVENEEIQINATSY
jgi:hypothetical protein